MNKIVRDHYPVQKLPDDLRSGLEEHGWVRIEIQPERADPAIRPLSSLVGTGRNVHGDPDSVLAHIRSLREDR
jgi:hypothetical protein